MSSVNTKQFKNAGPKLTQTNNFELWTGAPRNNTCTKDHANQLIAIIMKPRNKYSTGNWQTDTFIKHNRIT